VPGIVTHLRMGVEEFGREIGKGGLVQGKLALEGAIGHAAAPLEHGGGVVQELFKGHDAPPRRWDGLPPVACPFQARRHEACAARV
jgi:hypothetical protein